MRIIINIFEYQLTWNLCIENKKGLTIKTTKLFILIIYFSKLLVVKNIFKY